MAVSEADSHHINMKEKVQMNIEDYTVKRIIYREFAETVGGVLREKVKEKGIDSLYNVTFRAKDIHSMKKKLLKPEYKHLSNKIEEIKDLAGCRVIFYFNDDVDKFREFLENQKDFCILNKKYHYPSNSISKITGSEEYYTAIHFVVELVDSQKFPKFVGLRCEIQICTILDHAWSETSHNIIYKPQHFSKGDNVHKYLDSQFQKIVRDYIRPAGFEFQKLKNLENKVKRYKNYLKTKINDDTDIPSFIKEFNKSIPYRADFLKDDFPKILELVKIVLVKVENIATELKVFEESLEILCDLTYLNVKEIFLYLITLYISEKNTSKKKYITNASQRILRDIPCTNRPNINNIIDELKSIQDQTLQLLVSLDNDIKKSATELLATICKTILTPGYKQVNHTYENTKISFFALPGKDCESSRLKAISVLKELYNLKDGEYQKYVIEALQQSTKFPSEALCDEDLYLLMIKNSMDVVEFYTSLLNTASKRKLSLLNTKVEEIHFAYIHELKRFTYDKKRFPLLKNLIESANNFFNTINRNEEFVIYRILSGDRFFSIKTNAEKEQNLLYLVQKINENNKEEWKNRILSFLEFKSDNPEELPCLGNYLNILANQRPNFVIALLENHIVQLEDYLACIIDGLLQSNHRKEAILLINTWIGKDMYLVECAKFCLEEPLQSKLFNKLSATNNAEALTNLVHSVLRKYTYKKKHLIRKFFLPAVKLLTKAQSFEWWRSFGNNFEEIILYLERNEVDILVDSLLYIPNIDSWHEGIIKIAADKFPNKIINLFYDRIKISKTLNDNSYIPIPDSFYWLIDVFQNSPQEFIEIYKQLYVLEGKNTCWGNQLITNIFGISHTAKDDRLNPAFEEKLFKLINNKDEQNISMVMSLLKNFPWYLINNLCKELVKVLPNNKKYISEIRALLGFTGICIGDYGVTENNKKLKDEMEIWSEDENEKVQSFARTLIKELEDIRIPGETRMADKRVNS